MYIKNNKVKIIAVLENSNGTYVVVFDNGDRVENITATAALELIKEIKG